MKISRMLYILFVGWVSLVTIGSFLPSASFPSWVDLGGNRDKVAHFAAYFVTSLLFYLTFRTRFKRTDIYAMFFAAGYGAILELAQLLMPGRDCSFGDLAANFSGVLFFFVLYRLLWGKV
ncbi:MAG: VanZ family protein [Desulfobacterales bacterium]|nr:VanZ family protein [Desulfobacterales bacterium]